MTCLRLFALALAAAAALFSPMAVAQKPPIKIGIGIAQTGPLAGGGKAALLALAVYGTPIRLVQMLGMALLIGGMYLMGS